MASELLAAKLREGELAIQERDALRRQLARFVAMAPAVLMTMRMRTDGSLSVPTATSRIEEIFGLRPEEILSDASPMFARIHRDDVERVAAAIRSSADTGSAWVDEFRVNHPVRKEIWVEGHAAPERERDGSVLWSGFLRDVTERRQELENALRAQHELRDSEARFRQLTDTIREVFWLTDVTGMIVLYVSPAYEAIWGRSCASLYENPMQWIEAIHPEDRERVKQSFLTQANAGGYAEEFRLVRLDGTVRWVRDVALPVRDEAGKVIRIAGIAEDITDRRRLEAQLLQTQKMEGIGRLAGGVAHDFNNILTVVGGCTSELAGLVGHGQARELLLEINAAVDRASSLTRQLLAFSRQQVVELKAIELNTVVKDAERMLGRLLGEDITLHVRLGAELGRVKADATYLTQVLMNLTVNARDALPKGGHLSIETRNVSLDRAFCERHPGAEPGAYVLLAVADNGSGMSDDIKARAFEPFFSTKGVGKGTGLGLSVTHGIIQQFGGLIELSSRVDIGTEIEIYLPTLTEAQTKALSGRAPAPPGKETILLVEDDAGVRRVSVRILKAAGYTVIEARDGVHALEVFAVHKNEIDLMVTDVVMPEMDGRHLAEKVHEQRPELKVLYLSGYTDDAIVRYGISHAEMAFLQKPFSPSGLTDKVRETLDSE